ncbi:MAG: universal stress protein UspA related nucleotide-binding protein [uncultured archaeon A07HB70]|nr:MAG: universal stress protein UspA related nucleotide-binding protein [uncultured archaeon A07HB70]
MYDDLLVATDGDVASTDAVEHAVGLAAHHGARLYALHVVDAEVYEAYSGDEFVDANEGPEHALEERGRDALDEVAAQAAERGVETVTALEHGVPEERIRAYADRHAVDLVVLGTRRRPDEYRSLLGSTTERVTRLADQPVFVVKTTV